MEEIRLELGGASFPSMAAHAAARAMELSVRRAQLTEGGPPPRSDPNQARQRLDIAVQNARQAAERAHERAALAHDGAAALHDQLAARALGDVSWHESRSRHHRAAAEAERQRACGTTPRTGTA